MQRRLMMEGKNSFYNDNKLNIKKLMKSGVLSSFLSALVAVLLGLIFGFVIMLIALPANALIGFKHIILGGLKRIGDVFYYATPILMTGLSVGFANKMGLFN